MTIVYVGLGSNMGDTEQHIISALKSLGDIQSTKIMQTSSLYKSKPVGPQDQADYINAVARLDTELSALELLDELQAIENEHGRVRNEHWGPRTLDLDILMFGNKIINNDRLTVPHPEIPNRCFVLVPLAEIDSECVIPEAGNVRELIKKVDQEGLEIVQ